LVLAEKLQPLGAVGCFEDLLEKAVNTHLQHAATEQVVFYQQ